MLSNAQRKEYFAYLGLGEYNSANVLKVQKKYFKNADEHDGKYGNKTDIVVQNLYILKKYGKNFALPEFICECGGKYCTGYPAILDKNLIKNIQKWRDSYGSITITSGLRCKVYNSKCVGSSSTSRHMKGKALDFYNKKLTGTKSARTSTIKLWYSMANANYAYGNTSNMGNAVHVDVK